MARQEESRGYRPGATVLTTPRAADSPARVLMKRGSASKASVATARVPAIHRASLTGQGASGEVVTDPFDASALKVNNNSLCGRLWVNI
jgi:hypothetical protein